MKTKKKVEPKAVTMNSPVVFEQANTIPQKMEAIVNISKAILELSTALNGVNTTVEIKNNVISNSECVISIKSHD